MTLIGRKARSAALAALLAIGLAPVTGCSSKDVRNETIAQVNAEVIRAAELREFLGFRGGAVAAAGIPVEKKKEGLDRLIAGRLLAQDARAKGLDNTEEYRNALKENADGVLIAALFSRELAKVKVEKGEVRDEAKKLREADKNLPEAEAEVRAARAVFDRKARKVEEDLVAAAKKLTPGTIDQAAVQRIVNGEKVGDETVLATVGSEKISYGAVRRVLSGAMAAPHGGQDLSRNPVAIGRVVDREVTGKALVAYANKEGVAGSEWMKETTANLQRSVLINLLAEKVVFREISVSDKEVEAAYAEHGQMFVRDGRRIPLSEVREQIRAYLRNGKQKQAIDAYVAGLRKQAKITVNEKLLSEV